MKALFPGFPPAIICNLKVVKTGYYAWATNQILPVIK